MNFVRSKHFIIVNSNLFYSFLFEFRSKRRKRLLDYLGIVSPRSSTKTGSVRTGRRASPCEVQKRAKSTGLPGSIPHPIGGSVANQ